MTARRPTLSRFLVPLAALVATPLAVRAQELTAKPAEILETRYERLIKQPNVFSSDQSALRVTLQVDGPAAKGATKWGKLKLTEAVDDTGKDLKPKSEGGFNMSFGGGEDLQDINRFGMDEGKTAFDVPVDLALPERKATRLKSVKGEFAVLAGGEQKVVTVAKPKSQVGRSIDDDALKAAGVTMKFPKPGDSAFGGSSGAGNALVETGGKADVIRSVEILDAAGESVSQGYSSSTLDGTTATSYDLNKPLDDAMTVKVTLLTGQKEVVVPFEVKNVKLP